MAFVVKEFRAADLLRVLADACNIGSPWNMPLAKEEVRVFPDVWIVDDIAGEYLLRKHGAMREDGGRNLFLFFTHGVIIEFANNVQTSETSILKLDKRLEPYRSVIQEHFAAAAAVHFLREKRTFEPILFPMALSFLLTLIPNLSLQRTCARLAGWSAELKRYTATFLRER